MIVVDTSAVVESLTAWPPRRDLLRRFDRDADFHAPHLIDVEVLHALRGLLRAGKMELARAMDARSDFDDLAITRYPHTGLSDRMWQLRDNLSAYDAAFVALAELLEAPLVTTDARLARAADHAATIELFEL